MKSKLGVGLVALFVLVALLLNQPIMDIPQGMVSGVPAIIFYVFTVWLLVIAAMYYITRKHSNSDPNK